MAFQLAAGGGLEPPPPGPEPGVLPLDDPAMYQGVRIKSPILLQDGNQIIYQPFENFQG